MEDAKIIALYWQRNEDAIAQTDLAYGRRLHALADRMLRSREDAQESVNDTYLNTWTSIPPQRPTHFFAYLATVCRRLCLNRLDWNNAAKRSAEVVALTQEMESCIPDSRAQQAARGREIGQALNAFLRTLSKENRMVFLRRYWYADTIAEIASRYGMSQSKVKMLLSRSRARLRAYLETEGIEV